MRPSKGSQRKGGDAPGERHRSIRPMVRKPNSLASHTLSTSPKIGTAACPAVTAIARNSQTEHGLHLARSKLT
jgi:hypothetical protein